MASRALAFERAARRFWEGSRTLEISGQRRGVSFRKMWQRWCSSPTVLLTHIFSKLIRRLLPIAVSSAPSFNGNVHRASLARLLFWPHVNLCLSRSLPRGKKGCLIDLKVFLVRDWTPNQSWVKNLSEPHIRNVIRSCGTPFCCDYNALYCAASVSRAKAPHGQTEANLVDTPQQGLTLTPVGHVTPGDSPNNYGCHIPPQLWRTAQPTLTAMRPGERDTKALFRNNKSKKTQSIPLPWRTSSLKKHRAGNRERIEVSL